MSYYYPYYPYYRYYIDYQAPLLPSRSKARSEGPVSLQILLLPGLPLRAH